MEGHRRLYLHCQPAPGTPASTSVSAPTTRLTASTSPARVYIGPLGWFEYEAPPDSGFNFIITCPPCAPFTIDLTGRSVGLPAAAGFHGYPADVIPSPATYANTTMVQRSYTYSSSQIRPAIKLFLNTPLTPASLSGSSSPSPTG